ncbi:ImmA/IrrE family metallo-endopeptidase [Rhodococcus opacus]|uniref:ImmA/IrrE family metallo-endopeptidase n=1 Tax=Rhodococcus opacus TaxID=37919 RepID=UPI00358DFEED
MVVIRRDAQQSRRIVVDTDLSPAQAAKTMIHEAAHALMHAAEDVDPAELHRGRAEVEAESVAYVLAGLLGLDTSEYSIGYIAKWANGDTAAVVETAHTVLATVHTLAAALETQYESNTGETSAARRATLVRAECVRGRAFGWHLPCGLVGATCGVL